MSRKSDGELLAIAADDLFRRRLSELQGDIAEVLADGLEAEACITSSGRGWRDWPNTGD